LTGPISSKFVESSWVSICGLGSTMKQAQRQAYNRVRNVMIPNMYYREDIGDRWFEEDSDRLHSWHYLRE